MIVRVKTFRSLIKCIIIIFLICCNSTGIFAQNKDTLKNWHHSDYKHSKMHGISTTEAYNFLKNKKSTPVVVAIIDSGVDISHKDLNKVIWFNSKEHLDGLDSDENGYIDDINGWNFIGSPDGLNILYDNLELARKYLSLKKKIDPIPYERDRKLNINYKEYLAVQKEYEKVLLDAQSKYFTFSNIAKGVKLLNQLLQGALHKDTILIKDITQTNLNNTIISSNQDILSNLLTFKELLDKDNYSSLGEFINDLQEAINAYDNKIKFGLNLDFDPRCAVCDDYNNSNEHFYGNNNVIGPDPNHGTHVAGIITSNPTSTNMKSIAKNVKLMIIRVVPDGDERDKDIANGIKYAVDNGAKIINMSFGKYYSSDKNIVDSAVKYAEDHNVLMVHAAGNDGKNLDKSEYQHFPTATYQNGEKCNAWLEVGASSWKDGEEIAAPFTNYGHNTVDVLAPGVDIYSTIPDNKYKLNSGTSMAAPIVTGIAAVIRSYYPTLKASEVASIIKESSVMINQDSVIAPSDLDIEDMEPAELASIKNVKTLNFKDLSHYGIVNLNNAVRLAAKKTKKGFFNWIFSSKD